MATTETFVPTFVPNQLYDMPLADLQPDSNQPRKYLDPILLFSASTPFGMAWFHKCPSNRVGNTEGITENESDVVLIEAAY